jgi:hypothetical protein
MADPHSVTAGKLLGGAASLPVIYMGAHVDALVLGLVGAVFVSIWMPTINNRVRAFSAVMFSAVLAAYGSPVAAEWVSGTSAALTNTDSLRLMLAFAIGGGTPALFPLVLKFFGNKLNGGQQ